MKQPILVRILSLLLALTLVIGLAPMSVFATEIEETAPISQSEEAQETETPETTEAPVEEPTEAPVEEPTEAPVEEPTEAPVEEPTEAPVEEPTEAPVEEPTEAPVEEPTEAPVEEPTEAPVEEPTEAPVEEPTEAPVTDVVTKEAFYGLNIESMLTDTVAVATNKESTLAPGVMLNEIVAYTGDEHRAEIYVLEMDMSVDTVKIFSNYYNNQIDEFGMQKTTEQAAAFEANHPGMQVVAAINGSYYNMSNGEPNGAMVMEGVEMGNRSNDPNSRPFFAILKDGSAYIGHAGEYNAMKDQIQEAIGGEFSLVVDGNNVRGVDADKYPRQTIGITADGRVITMLADGYRYPYSDGTTVYEQAEIMKSLGCVDAIHLDGGGSATTCAKPEGEDTLQVVSTPGDKFERPVSSTLVIVSTAAASDAFHHAVLSAEADYVTPGSTVAITAAGVSTSGHSAALPSDAMLQVDASMGTIVDGAYVAADGFTGDAVIEMVSGGAVVGSTTVHVVIPTAMSFSGEKLVVKHGNTADLVLEATINDGMNLVTIKASDIAFTWADDAALGTIDGFAFAASSDATLTGPVVLTAALVYDETISDTLKVSLTDLPDEPVVVADFEDQVGYRISSGYPESNWLDKSYGIVDATTGKVHSGNYAFKCALSPNTAGDIPVPQGYWSHSYSMGNPSDSSVYTYAAGENANEFLAGKEFASVDLTNAASFGMWIYLPEDTFQNQIQVFLRNAQDGATYQWMVYELGYTYSEEGHTGWTYFELDFEELNAAQGKTFNDGNWYIERLRISCGARRPDQMNAGAGYDFGYEPAGHQSQTGYVEYYFDDFTVEYLELDVDRVDPDFTTISMSYGGNSGVDVNGQTITSNKVSFSAAAIDESKLDADSAKAYIDGNKVAVEFNNGTLTVDALTLADGTHTITFVISDEHGNCDYITRQFVVNAGSGIPTVTVKGNENNAADDQLKLGALYWVDVEVDNIESVDTITMNLNLDACSNWELKGMEVPYGFTASYSIDNSNNSANITITKTGEVELTGHQVIAKLPVRAWYYQNGKLSPIGNIAFNGGWWSPFDVRVQCDKGVVTYDDDTQTVFSMTNIDCDTELYDWYYVMQALGNIPSGKTHVHSAAAIDDKAATCTEGGYTGRTFCEACNSVVEWGTIIPATGHKYEVVDGVAKCTNENCDKKLTGELDGKMYKDGALLQGWVDETYYYVDGVKVTGIYAVDGVYYDFGEDGASKGKVTGLFVDPASGKYCYALLGVLKTGWILIEEDWHYFDENGHAVSGKIENFYTGVTYEFEENGKLIDGVWVKDDNGSRYWYGPAYYKAAGTNSLTKYAFFTIDGNEYCFNTSGYRLEGIHHINKSSERDLYWYDFGTDGVAKAMTDVTGFLEYEGELYFIREGVSYYEGLFQYEGAYYYVNSLYHVVRNTKYHVLYTNDLIAPNGQAFAVGDYNFDENGKMIVNGVTYWASELRYLVDGVPTAAGLIYDETEGCYYYARTGGNICFGEYYVYTSRTNGLLPAGNYDFGTDGKLFIGGENPDPNPDPTPDPDPEVKNGFVYENGAYYYYVDGVLTYAGLIYDEAEGCYYYVRSNYKMATGTYHVYAARTNGLLPAGTYDFGTDGKLFIEKDETKNGFVYENGDYYYYVDGVLTYAGLIYDETEGCYYYVRSNYKMATGAYHVYASRTNGLLPAGTYDFGTDGKLFIGGEESKPDETKDGFAYENGDYYYYVDGVLTYAGLIYDETEGCYYYVRSNYKMATGVYHVYASRTNGLLPAGDYDFGTDGKLFINN